MKLQAVETPGARVINRRTRVGRQRVALVHQPRGRRDDQASAGAVVARLGQATFASEAAWARHSIDQLDATTPGPARSFLRQDRYAIRRRHHNQTFVGNVEARVTDGK